MQLSNRAKARAAIVFFVFVTAVACNERVSDGEETRREYCQPGPVQATIISAGQVIEHDEMRCYCLSDEEAMQGSEFRIEVANEEGYADCKAAVIAAGYEVSDSNCQESYEEQVWASELGFPSINVPDEPPICAGGDDSPAGCGG